MAQPDAACVIIPTLNEIDHIGPLLDMLLADPQMVVGEILVADGGSTDGTREVVRARMAQSKRIRLIDNPDRIQSAGINRAVAEADPALKTLVRIDAHAEYPADYVSRLLTAMAERQADSVAVRLETIGRTPLQEAVAAASNSRIGTGGSAHRVDRGSGWVDHGHHAAFRRAMFVEAGGYDESFEANEDAEFDYRLRALGGRIWLASDIPVRYLPRCTLGALARQYRRYGSGRARTFLKHRERLRLRQMLPPLVTVTILASLVEALVSPIFLVIPVTYVAAVTIVAIMLAWRARSPKQIISAAAIMTMHLSWGFGFLQRMAIAAFSPITRRGDSPSRTKPAAAPGGSGGRT